MPKSHHLRDAYRHPGFVPAATVRIEDDADETYVLPLRRRQKKHAAANAIFPLVVLMTTSFVAAAISIVVATRSISNLNSDASIVRGAV